MNAESVTNVNPTIDLTESVIGLCHNDSSPSGV